jgi:diguanylate cyclase (GGDEF)-like protein
MQSLPLAPAAAPGVRANRRISRQIRRFALVWLGAAILVMVGIAATRTVSNGYRDNAIARERAASAAQQSETRLQEALQQEVNDRLAWEISRNPQYLPVLRADSARTRAAAAALAAAARSHAPTPVWVQVSQLAASTRVWELGMSTAFSPARRGLSGGVPAPPPPAVDGRAATLDRALTSLSTALDRQAAAAGREADHRAWQADAMRLTASVFGLLVLLLGGGLLLQKAWGLAVDADARREREHRWGQQIEAVLAWSSRAKSATTRSQLIGFAHMAPRDAIGASCLIVSEGAPPRHASHGLPRITVPVDEAGQGLHVSVCFAAGRGDELDHHTLDLMLGHLAALWRTVLRQEDLERAAGHDALTGLPNRRTFEAELRRRVNLSRRRGLGFTLAMVDLDHFKLVNDQFGHPEGDTVLRRAGEAIRAVLRGSDRIYRLGGEEFALLLETAEPDGVEEVLDRAREAVKALGVEPAPGRRTSASIGWAVFPYDAEDRAQLVAAADAALYTAKNGGRDRVVRCGENAAAA